jgi:hypothetical protein
MENVMSTKVKLPPGILFPYVLFLFFPLLLTACGRWTITVLPAPSDTPPVSQPGVVFSKTLTFTAAVKELGTTEAGRQDISLGRIRQPGQYVLQLTNDNAPYSSHWIEWDYLALKAGNSYIWQIGQDETPPDYNDTGRATDEFCDTGGRTDCRTGFQVTEGKIDERNLAKTLNDGIYPVVRIAFTVTQEQTGADLDLTLSTLYSSHVPDTKDFRMQVTLLGPY